MTDEKKDTRSDAPESDPPKASSSSAPPKASAQTKSEPPAKPKTPSKPPPTKKQGQAGGGAYRLPASNPWAGAWRIAAGVGVVGLGASLFGMTTDAKRFAFSYLFAFESFLMVALGCLFFVLYQHLTSAGWSVTVRRTAEFFGAGLGVFAILFVPIWLNRAELYPWLSHAGGHAAESHHAESAGSEHATPEVGTAETHSAQVGADQAERADESEPASGEAAAADKHEGAEGEEPESATPDDDEHGRAAAHGEAAGHDEDELAFEEAAEERILADKQPYLNTNFFAIRAVIYLLIWALLGWQLLKMSTSQDTSRDPKTTLAMKILSAPATIAFALSLTFAGFDWVMSLEPMWYSTIFGVYMFAGAAVSSLAVLIIITMGLKSSGAIKNEINVEHYHDLGKLLFGFNVFWAYIGFSQFMLIWYAAIPEEVTYYHRRWGVGPWSDVSMILLIGHFVVPFFWLLSRNVKRKLPALRIGAFILLALHLLDVYWMVMPNYAGDGFAFHWLDVTTLLGVGGIYFAVVLFFMKDHALIPVGDPRLKRALAFENA